MQVKGLTKEALCVGCKGYRVEGVFIKLALAEFAICKECWIKLNVFTAWEMKELDSAIQRKLKLAY